LKEISKLLAYVVAVVVGGALLAPPLFWTGQALIAADLLPQLAPFGFEKYLNRAFMVLALGLLWPWLRWMGLHRWTDLFLTTNPRRWRDLGTGLALGVGGLVTVALGLVTVGTLDVRGPLTAPDIVAALATGAIVALIEEAFFRGALFGLLRRNLSWWRALAFLSVFFAVLHFVRPDPAVGRVTQVGWNAGLALLPHLFWQFGHPELVLGTWVTLLVMGWTLGYTVVRTTSLYLAIGLHAGWVFGLKALMACTQRRGEANVWVGEDLRSGLLATGLMLVTFVVLTLLLGARSPEERAP
jgi:membrane protease YdiL (CAAX protease family)